MAVYMPEITLNNLVNLKLVPVGLHIHQSYGAAGLYDLADLYVEYQF
jgi:hypothetical protein